MNELRVKDRVPADPFEDAFAGLMRPWRSELLDRAPRIRIDVSEKDDAYTIKADMPGVRKEDIDVRVDRNVVTISAEVKDEHEERKDGRVLRSERHVGYASRSFSLDADLDDARAAARYKDGVLELTLPKKAGASTRRLSVE